MGCICFIFIPVIKTLLLSELGLMHNLHTLEHSWCKRHITVKRHAVGEVVSADGNCMSEQTIHTNRKLKFLTT